MKRKTLTIKGLILGSALATSLATQAATLAVNFSHGGFPVSTGIGADENTNALNAITGLINPTWHNLAVNGAGSTANGQGVGTFSGVGVAAYGSNVWSGGSEGVVSGDASQQVFRIYLDDGEAGNSYFSGDGIGASIHLTGIASYMTANNASSYTLTLFFSSDTANNNFRDATVRSGIPGTPSATAITDLTLLGTVSDTLIGNGQAPLDNNAAGGGTRSWGSLSGLTADDIVVSLPGGFVAGERASISGFAITAIPEPSTIFLSFLSAGILFHRKRR